MNAPRSIWSGTITFGMVAVPVKLAPAVKSKAVAFHQVDKRDGARIRYAKLNAATGEVVDPACIGRGYDPGDGGPVIVLEDEELDALAPERNRAVALDRFVSPDEIAPALHDTTYLVMPDKLPRPYALLARALTESGKVGVGRFTMRNREALAMIRARDGVLMLTTLAWPDEMVDTAPLSETVNVEVPDAEAEMARSLLDAMSGEFEADAFRDLHRERVEALLAEKMRDRQAPAAASANIVNIADALMASIDAAKAAKKESAPKRRRKAS